MTDTINNTVYDSDRVSEAQASFDVLMAELEARGFDPEVFLQNADGLETLAISRDDPVYQSLVLFLGQNLAYLLNGSVEDGLLAQFADSDIDWSSWEAFEKSAEEAGLGELVPACEEFLYDMASDAPELLAAVTTLNYGSQEGNALLAELNADISKQNTSASEDSEITLDEARALMDAYGLDGLEDFASFEESSLEIQASLTQQLAEAQQYFAEIMADPSLSDEEKSMMADQSSSHQSLLMMELQNAMNLTSTMAQMVADIEKTSTDTERQLASG